MTWVERPVKHSWFLPILVAIFKLTNSLYLYYSTMLNVTTSLNAVIDIMNSTDLGWTTG